VHIRSVGNFTKALSKAVGCDFEHDKDRSHNKSEVVGLNDDTEKPNRNSAIRRILPRVYLDGPFGSASEDVFKYEIAVLVGAGIGVTPFASILKSVWYRMNYPKEKTRLRKVYFFWVCRDFGSFEWFRSLLLAIEAQDLDNHIEIHTVRLPFLSPFPPPRPPSPLLPLSLSHFLPLSLSPLISPLLPPSSTLSLTPKQYLTAKIKTDDATNIMINNHNASADAITGLRAETSFGRPNWDRIFKSIRKIHSPAEAGVFFCGPKPLGSALHVKCNMYSEPGFNFVWGKENF